MSRNSTGTRPAMSELRDLTADRLRADLVEYLSRHHLHPLVRGTATLARGFLRASSNYSYDINRNGESWVLETLNPSVVFDVGANRGDYAAAVLKTTPSATVHCFELIPSTAEDCRQRFAGNPGVTVHPFGLADEARDVEVRYFVDQPRLSSLIAEHDLPFTLVQGRVERGDDVLARSGSERLDLLKVDAEGVDYEVLLGFGEAFAQGRVAVVQFEYGPLTAESGHLLRDHYELLEGHGFRVGKLYPDSIDFRPYDVWLDEDFRGPNYIAVHRTAEKRDVLERRGSRSRQR